MSPTEAVKAVARHYGVAVGTLTERYGATSVVAEPRLVLLCLWRDMGLTFDMMARRMGVAPATVYYRWRAVQEWHREAAGEIRKEMGGG